MFKLVKVFIILSYILNCCLGQRISNCLVIVATKRKIDLRKMDISIPVDWSLVNDFIPNRNLNVAQEFITRQHTTKNACKAGRGEGMGNNLHAIETVKRTTNGNATLNKNRIRKLGA